MKYLKEFNESNKEDILKDVEEAFYSISDILKVRVISSISGRILVDIRSVSKNIIDLNIKDDLEFAIRYLKNKFNINLYEIIISGIHKSLLSSEPHYYKVLDVESIYKDMEFLSSIELYFNYEVFKGL